MKNMNQIVSLWVNKNDEMAFNKIYKYYKPRLTSFLLNKYANKTKIDNKGLSYSEIQDVVTDSFLKIIQNKDKYNEKYKFSTWIFNITRNHAVDMIRSKGRVKNKSINSFYFDGTDEEMVEAFDVPVSDDFDIFENEQEFLEVEDNLINNIKKYTKKHDKIEFRIFHDRYFKNEELDDLTTIFNCNKNKVKNGIFQTKKMIQEKFLDDYNNYKIIKNECLSY